MLADRMAAQAIDLAVGVRAIIAEASWQFIVHSRRRFPRSRAATASAAEARGTREARHYRSDRNVGHTRNLLV
jgi:hypothetical protein